MRDRLPYYEEFIALWGWLRGFATGRIDPTPRLTFDRADADRLGMSWADYCRMRHEEDEVERALEAMAELRDMDATYCEMDA